MCWCVRQRAWATWGWLPSSSSNWCGTSPCHQRLILLNQLRVSDVFMPPTGQTEALCSQRVCSSVRPSITKLVITTCWKWMNWFLCHLTEILHSTRAWRDYDGVSRSPSAKIGCKNPFWWDTSVGTVTQMFTKHDILILWWRSNLNAKGQRSRSHEAKGRGYR